MDSCLALLVRHALNFIICLVRISFVVFFCIFCLLIEILFPASYRRFDTKVLWWKLVRWKVRESDGAYFWISQILFWEWSSTSGKVILLPFWSHPRCSESLDVLTYNDAVGVWDPPPIISENSFDCSQIKICSGIVTCGFVLKFAFCQMFVFSLLGHLHSNGSHSYLLACNNLHIVCSLLCSMLARWILKTAEKGLLMLL